MTSKIEGISTIRTALFVAEVLNQLAQRLEKNGYESLEKLGKLNDVTTVYFEECRESDKLGAIEIRKLAKQIVSKAQ